MSTECNRILVALSGGVDSAVSASILLQEGYQVEAVYVKTWEHEKDVLGDCPGALDLRDAETVSAQLGIPFRVINLMDFYRQHVVFRWWKDMLRESRQTLTFCAIGK